ncbi:MAG: hypothetical protein KAS15_02870 [Nanoarchaeota archaeon]|nr:hypothetical protein [Nanoarchaeota archaeon]MCK5630507.1 hypothetical protein [Nanoarchaeota archaeon]
MTKPDIVEEIPITMSELAEEISNIKKRDKELNYRAAKTEDYLQQIGLDSKKAKELYDKIKNLNVPRLKDAHLIKIVDLMPDNAEDVKTLLSGYTLTVTQDNMKKIAAVVKELKE